jgi:hypothetical protein
MAHGIAKIEDLGDEVGSCSCYVDETDAYSHYPINSLSALFCSAHSEASSDVALIRVSSLRSIRLETAKYNESIRSIYSSGQTREQIKLGNTNLGKPRIHEWFCEAKKNALQVNHKAVACNRFWFDLHKKIRRWLQLCNSARCTCIPARLTFNFITVAKYSRTASRDSAEARTRVLNIWKSDDYSNVS